jgi:heme-degrading monooxygenase HmoA
MYARMLSSRVKHDQIDESIRIWREEVIPAAQMQSGFLGVTLLIDRENDTGSSISLWSSLAALEAAEANGFVREQTARLSAYIAGPVERRVYEVPIAIAPRSAALEEPALNGDLFTDP